MRARTVAARDRRLKFMITAAVLAVVLIFPAVVTAHHGPPPKPKPKIPTLTGNWGCLGTGASENSTSLKSFSIGEVIQMTAGNNAISRGSIVFNGGSEACQFTITGGNYLLNLAGVGTLDLQISIPASNPEGDFTCDELLGLPSGMTSTVMHYDVVVAAGAKQISFSSQDDFVDQAPDKGDFPSLGGQCLRQ